MRLWCALEIDDPLCDLLFVVLVVVIVILMDKVCLWQVWVVVCKVCWEVVEVRVRDVQAQTQMLSGRIVREEVEVVVMYVRVVWVVWVVCEIVGWGMEVLLNGPLLPLC